MTSVDEDHRSWGIPMDREAQIDDVLTEEQPFLWHDVAIRSIHLPGHCYVHAGYLLTFNSGQGPNDSPTVVSWKVERMTKEFFFLLLFLSAGAYGFFMSLDLFVMFFFLELAVIPKFLLIAIWGSGRKEYSANKLALMLMGGKIGRAHV